MKLNKLFFNNSNNIYFNIRVCALEYKRDCWHSIVAVDESNRIIKSSNHFFQDYYESAFQENKYKIYSRLDSTYQHILKTSHEEHICINQECFLMANSFSGVNSGHDLSILLDSIDYMIKHKIKTAILLSASQWYPNNLELISFFLKNYGINLIFIDFSKVFLFKKVHILPKEHMNIMKHQYLIDAIIKHNQSIEFTQEQAELFNKKILLLKCHRNSQVARRDTSLTCERLLKKLESEGYIYINPENMDIHLLIRVLQTAHTIISSWGGVLYTNMPFFNINAKTLLIIVDGLQHFNHHWKYITTKSTLFHVKNPILDSDQIASDQLYNKIKTF